jgi:glycosyltransferase involved in cell wall biosynthesis
MRSFSVAMCTYNGELFLQSQLKSIAEQTYLLDELVICDDGSTDSTLQILHDFKDIAPFKIRIYKNKERLGPTKNFEKAIKLCTSDIIILSDQDDFWVPNKIENIERIFRYHPKAAYCFSNAILTNEVLSPLGYTVWDSVLFTLPQREYFKQGHQIEILLKHNVVTGATMAFKSSFRNCILPIPEQWMHDAWIALMLSGMNQWGVFIEEPLIYYRQHSNQVVGGRKIGFRKKIQMALNKKEEVIKAEYIFKFIQVIDRLDSLNKLTKNNKRLIELKIQHLKARESIYIKPSLKSLHILVKEFITGRYGKFSNGWESAFKDLILIFIN